jgi:hypothetical protein
MNTQGVSIFKLSKSAISAMFKEKAGLTVFLPDKALLIAMCSGGNDSLYGAEKKALLLALCWC